MKKLSHFSIVTFGALLLAVTLALAQGVPTSSTPTTDTFPETGAGASIDAGFILVARVDAGSIVTTQLDAGIIFTPRINFNGTSESILDEGGNVMDINGTSPLKVSQSCVRAGSTQNVPLEICGNPSGTGATVDASAAGKLTIGGATATSVIVGTSTTTTPIQIAGASGGAFKGTCTMSAATSCTVTVPSGALCICFPQSTEAVGTNNPFGSTTTTTFTCNSGGTANSLTWTVLCL